MKRVVVVLKDDLVYYPPTISLLNILIEMGLEVECVGIYSDVEGKARLEENGVKFVPISRNIKDCSRIRLLNWIMIIWRMHKYTRALKQYLSNAHISSNDLIWFIYNDSIGLLQPVIEQYPYLLHFYEFEDYSLGGRGKLLHPRYDPRRLLSKAKALVHCEYNRAMITNGLYGLNKEIFVLPNKPFENKNEYALDSPEEIANIVEEVKNKTKGHKVILYQGIFNAAERRLDEFCEAIKRMPEDYIFIAMGGGGDYYEEMKKKYNSDRILFLPFIRPPYHLLITQIANYGVLTYHPAGLNYVDVINPLYCAPNKIFEYSKFGIPMVANDVPGLKLIFDTFNCGKIIGYPITPEKIIDCFMTMDIDYSEMSKGAKQYYDSVDVKGIVKDILEKAK